MASTVGATKSLGIGWNVKVDLTHLSVDLLLNIDCKTAVFMRQWSRNGMRLRDSSN